MATNIPSNAQAISFGYGRGKSCKFYVWQTKGGKWQWDAMGNNGEAETKDKAAAAAREWITDGFNKFD